MINYVNQVLDFPRSARPFLVGFVLLSFLSKNTYQEID